MPPKGPMDPNAVHLIYIKVIGGEPAAQAALAPKEPPRDRKKVKNVEHKGNLKLDHVVEIARIMRAKSYAAEFPGTVKEILGTCMSIGCTVDKKSPRDVQREIDDGEHD